MGVVTVQGLSPPANVRTPSGLLPNLGKIRTVVCRMGRGLGRGEQVSLFQHSLVKLKPVIEVVEIDGAGMNRSVIG
jgi:hypothetical protein